jgi:hypothetical protein
MSNIVKCPKCGIVIKMSKNLVVPKIEFQICEECNHFKPTISTKSTQPKNNT